MDLVCIVADAEDFVDVLFERGVDVSLVRD